MPYYKTWKTMYWNMLEVTSQTLSELIADRSAFVAGEAVEA